MCFSLSVFKALYDDILIKFFNLFDFWAWAIFISALINLFKFDYITLVLKDMPILIILNMKKKKKIPFIIFLIFR